MTNKQLVPACPKCGSNNLIKKGFNDGQQRFICKECRFKTTKPKMISIKTVADRVEIYEKKTIEEQARKNANELLDEISKLRAELAVLKAIQAPEGVMIRPMHSRGTSESVPVLQVTDAHSEEIVEAKKVNYLNEYNPEICKRRFSILANRTVKMVKLYQQDTRIDNMIVQLGGDMITGNIHEENLEICAMPPVQALLFAEGLIIGLFEFLLTHTRLDFEVICNGGNHPRITKKIHHSTEEENNLEVYMYYVLAKHFSYTKRIRWHIAEGYFQFANIYDKIARFHHGHAIKYNGGVGGLAVPLKRAIYQWNSSKKADVDFLGHFHTSLWSRFANVNGSIIGYNAFALKMKCEFEPAQQNLILFNKQKKDMTFVSPIYLD